jgi:hypothetical protein
MGKKRKFADLGVQAEEQAKREVESGLRIGFGIGGFPHLCERSSSDTALCGASVRPDTADYYLLRDNKCLPCDKEYARLIGAKVAESARNHWSKPAAQSGYVAIPMFEEAR